MKRFSVVGKSSLFKSAPFLSIYKDVKLPLGSTANSCVDISMRRPRSVHRYPFTFKIIVFSPAIKIKTGF